ncbi:MAG: tRNA (guanosine(37)-N1)-methyltransferase TrmD [Smithellaceae bacterium]|nr:tRNA (guanosine(37)-N1)-methyltransferase TrmD [Smithellaceae bacterium]
MIKFDILTLFPEMFSSPLNASIIKKARDKGLVDISIHDIRDYAEGKHRVTDDEPYGGGGGMVMKVVPIDRALEAIVPCRDNVTVVLLTPQGETFNQGMASELARLKRLVLICGHYEGVDERVREHLVDREISIGDYVLTGGELSALVVVDAVSRLVAGVLGNTRSALDDSFATGLLEHPHYTRPMEYRAWRVPEVLLNGNHKQIEYWRRRESLRRTSLRRPDLLEKLSMGEEDLRILEEIKKGCCGQQP